ncbi:MAG: HlyD family efflux transporter periplasmic adaptor subunit [Planctomycetota bacterium]|jgi:biotin carboxyl carrier protein
MSRSGDNKTKKTADAALSDLIKQFQKTNGDPGQFLLNLLAAQCLLGPAEGGAVLRLGGQTNIDVIALYPQLKGKDAPAPRWLARSAKFAHEAISSDAPVVKPLQNSDGPGSQPDGRHIVMIPWPMADIGKAVTTFLIQADAKTDLESSSRRLQLLVSMLSHSQLGSAQRNWRQSCRRLQKATETLSAVNRQNRFTSAAMAFCNEVASQWQCERVNAGFLKGRYVQLKAMSHTEHFSRKMEAVQYIESAMEECLDQDVEILSPRPGDSAYVGRATDKLAERHGPLAVLSLPMRVLTLERSPEKAFGLDEIETVRLACELCTARLADLHEHDRWIGALVARRARSSLAKLVGPKHTWAKVAAILCFGAILFVLFAKGQFRPDAPFVLEATSQTVVPAPFDGYIKTVEVEIGDTVTGGSSVLAGLDTAELRLSLAAAKAERVGYLKQASAAMRDGETAQAQIAQADADRAQAQIELLEYQISQASLVSQISGVVVTGDLKRQIGAPVKTGDVLFEVCPLEALRAQLMVPEDEIYDIEVGQEGYLATASYPAQRIRFRVERINPVAGRTRGCDPVWREWQRCPLAGDATCGSGLVRLSTGYE